MFKLKHNKFLVVVVIIIIVILSLFYLLISYRNSNKFEKIITLKKKYIHDSMFYKIGKNKHLKFRIIDSKNQEYKFNKNIGGMLFRYSGIKDIYESLQVGKKYKIFGQYSTISKIEEVNTASNNTINNAINNANHNTN